MEGKRKELILISVLAFVLIIPGRLAADVITLGNGDRLSGRIISLEDGKLTLKTDYAGHIKIDVDKIADLAMEATSEVRLKSGEVLGGRITGLQDGNVLLEPETGGGEVGLAWKEVVSVNAPRPRWKGSVTVGGSAQSGNTSTRTVSIGAEADRKTGRDRFGFRFLLNNAEENGELTARNAYCAAKYDYFLTRRFYLYYNLQLLRDEFQDLNLRTRTGPGAGFQIWEASRGSLLVEAGIAYIWEDHREFADSHYPALRLGTEFRLQIFKFLSFSDRLSVYPSLEYAGEYTLRNESALSSPLGSGWALRLANVWERNSDPPPGILKDDFTTTLGLQYSF